MFGLLLIVFSFYFRDKQLNKFDKKQIIYALDSLKSLKEVIDDRMNLDSAKASSSKRILSDNAFKINTLPLLKEFTDSFKNYHFNKDDTIISNLYDRIMKIKLDNYTSNDMQLYNKYTDRLIYVLAKYQRKVNNEVDYYNSQLIENQFDFKLLLSIGIFLFVPGILLWYFKIQKPQDELLTMQLDQIKQSISDNHNSNNIVMGRKHYDPINNKKTL